MAYRVRKVRGKERFEIWEDGVYADSWFATRAAALHRISLWEKNSPDPVFESGFSDELLGEMTGAKARERDLALAIATLTTYTEPYVRGRLRGNRRVRDIFAPRWPARVPPVQPNPPAPGRMAKRMTNAWAGRWAPYVERPGPTDLPGYRTARPTPVRLDALADEPTAAVHVERSMRAAPLATSFQQLARRLVMCIHTIGKIQGVGLDRLAVYIGRSSWTQGHILSRWDEHAQGKKHTGAMVVAVCHRESVKSWELGLIRMKGLLERRHGQLCIAKLENRALDARGCGPATELAPIYLTWRVSAQNPRSAFPDIETIEAVAMEVEHDCRDLTPSIQASAVLAALAVASKPEMRFLRDVSWAHTLRS